jgi:NADPH-dependent glutamate synthase beta subunit-like oxidoreductase
MPEIGHYFIGIIGGAIAGSVAAEILADHGIEVAVFEQNKRPYGKIEDGLPRWHVEQRKQEYERIDARLRKPGVFFIPCTKLGRDVDFQDLSDHWGFSALILANGAWRDRELGIAGAERFVGKGLVYQNPFIYWYNHKHEKSYMGPQYEAPDEALVVGGGLASIDVVKVLQIENYERALKARGIQTSMHQLETKGIPGICKMHGIQPEDCGIKGCLLIYRRREQDMPLAQPPENASPEQAAKTELVRQKILRLAREKYLFRFRDRTLSTGLVEEHGRLVGLQVTETRVEGRKVEPIQGSEHVLRTPLVISSIGSVPETVPGITMQGEYYAFQDEALPRYSGCDRVFGVGNVVTGQGNIRVSLVHSRDVTNQLIQNHLVTSEDDSDSSTLRQSAVARVAARAKAVQQFKETLPALSTSEVAAIKQRIHTLQERVGYTVDYDSWIARETPSDRD